MTTIAHLYSGTELAIQNMHLMPPEEDKVRRTVQKYAYPESCCKIICWIIYRIVQAVKSLFGCSDWQVTEKMVHNRWLCIAIERGVVQQNPQNRLEELIKERSINRSFPVIFTELLEIAVFCQENGAVLCQENGAEADRIRDKIQKLDFLSAMDYLQASLLPIRASIAPNQPRLDAIFAHEGTEHASPPPAA